MKNKPGVAAAAAAAAASASEKHCEDESLLYLLDCLMMLYSAAVHRVLREVRIVVCFLLVMYEMLVVVPKLIA